MADLHTLVTTREIDAPLDQVWGAWHDPEKKHVEDFHAIEGSQQLLERLEEQAR